MDKYILQYGSLAGWPYRVAEGLRAAGYNSINVIQENSDVHGGIQSLDQAKAIFDIGFEKVAINSSAVKNPSLIVEIARQYGSQAVIVSIDVKRSFFGNQTVRTNSGKRSTKLDPMTWAKEVENLGGGEILLTSIDREGTWEGFDLALVRSVADAVSIPVIAHGGAGCLDDIGKVVKQAGASAVALGSLIVFQKKGMGVLVNFPDQRALERVLS